MIDDDSRDSNSLDELETAAEVASSVIIGATQGPLGAAAALVKLSAALYRRRAGEVAKRRMQRLELELERLLSENPELAAVVVPDDPEQSEIFFRIYRSIMDAKDERAVGPLVRLTSAYIRKDRDPFFFAAGKLFEELLGDEFETLKIVLDACLEAPEHAEVVAAFARGGVAKPHSRVEVTWWLRDPEEARTFTYVEVAGERAMPVILALKRYGIATDSGAGGAGEQSAPGKMIVRTKQVRRLRPLLGR